MPDQTFDDIASSTVAAWTIAEFLQDTDGLVALMATSMRWRHACQSSGVWLDRLRAEAPLSFVAISPQLATSNPQLDVSHWNDDAQDTSKKELTVDFRRLRALPLGAIPSPGSSSGSVTPYDVFIAVDASRFIPIGQRANEERLGFPRAADDGVSLSNVFRKISSTISNLFVNDQRPSSTSSPPNVETAPPPSSNATALTATAATTSRMPVATSILAPQGSSRHIGSLARWYRYNDCRWAAASTTPAASAAGESRGAQHSRDESPSIGESVSRSPTSRIVPQDTINRYSLELSVTIVRGFTPPNVGARSFSLFRPFISVRTDRVVVLGCDHASNGYFTQRLCEDDPPPSAAMPMHMDVQEVTVTTCFPSSSSCDERRGKSTAPSVSAAIGRYGVCCFDGFATNRRLWRYFFPDTALLFYQIDGRTRSTVVDGIRAFIDNVLPFCGTIAAVMFVVTGQEGEYRKRARELRHAGPRASSCSPSSSMTGVQETLRSVFNVYAAALENDMPVHPEVVAALLLSQEWPQELASMSRAIDDGERRAGLLAPWAREGRWGVVGCAASDATSCRVAFEAGHRLVRH